MGYWYMKVSKKVNRKVQGVPQSQTAANPRYQEEKNDKSTQTSSLFPKWGDRNAKRNDKTRGQRAQEDFKTISAS